MHDARPLIRLPLGFPSEQTTVVADLPHDDEQFAVRQIEFIRHVVGRSEFLRAHDQTTPLSDAFLSAIVTLLDVLVENSPDEAERCVTQLRQILDTTFPNDGIAGFSAPSV
jgi:hypothetical protein